MKKIITILFLLNALNFVFYQNHNSNNNHNHKSKYSITNTNIKNDRIITNYQKNTIKNYLNSYKDKISKTNQKVKFINDNQNNNNKLTINNKTLKENVNYVDLKDLANISLFKNNQQYKLSNGRYFLDENSLLLIYKNYQLKDKNTYFSYQNDKLYINENQKHILTGQYQVYNYENQSALWIILGVAVGTVIACITAYCLYKVIQKIIEKCCVFVVEDIEETAPLLTNITNRTYNTQELQNVSSTTYATPSNHSNSFYTCIESDNDLDKPNDETKAIEKQQAKIREYFDRQIDVRLWLEQSDFKRYR